MAKHEKTKESKPAGTIVKQADFPAMSLDQALRIPTALLNDFAGQGAAPHEVALALGLTPTSSNWRMLCGAAIAYGLTEGSYGAEEIKLMMLRRGQRQS
jgi:hypothetical protein